MSSSLQEQRLLEVIICLRFIIAQIIADDSLQN